MEGEDSTGSSVEGGDSTGSSVDREGRTLSVGSSVDWGGGGALCREFSGWRGGLYRTEFSGWTEGDGGYTGALTLTFQVSRRS